MTRIELLRSLKASLPAHPRIAEVGVLRGTYTASLHSILAPSRLVLVDAWRVFPRADYGDYKDLTQAKWDAMAARVRTKFGDLPGVEILRDLSVAASHRVPAASLDFIYLDCNHSYIHVLADLDVWVPKLKPGGVFAGHDYDRAGVRRAVEEYRNGAPVNLTTEKSCVTYWWPG